MDTMDKKFDLNKLVRENIKKLKPYTSARDEYKGSEGIFLDANENSFGSVTEPAWNRYPDPLQEKLKERISQHKRVNPENIFLGNGSDEPIDLLFRAFCRPGVDNTIILPPTYGMYEVAAGVNDVEVKEVLLTEDYQIRSDAVLEAVNEYTKIIWVCSPNNPTGNAVRQKDVIALLQNFQGLVVVDEAYIDFAPDKSMVPFLGQYPNLVVLQTFSKAWGMAALRLGMAFASQEIIGILNKIKYPYNISGATQKFALDGLRNLLKKEHMVEQILSERERLKEELEKVAVVQKVYPSDANFLLVKTINADKIYAYLIDHKVITRNRSMVKLCDNSLRITVGTKEEDNMLIAALKKFEARH